MRSFVAIAPQDDSLTRRQKSEDRRKKSDERKKEVMGGKIYINGLNNKNSLNDFKSGLFFRRRRCK